jgi:hypothetical protein
MHRMNANRNSVDGTSTMGNSAIQNIKKNMDIANQRRVSKHNKNKKVASSSTPKPQKKTGRLIVANLEEIPNDFERIGTGFYRKGHHLWELAPAKNGFVLVRKHGEDHVLGYDPDPIIKESNAVHDRLGNNIKIGSKVALPHHGKIAQGVVYLMSPQSLGLELDSGEKISAPPDMLEIVDSLMGGLMNFIDEGEATEKEENKEEHNDEEEEKEENGSFEPAVESSSKKAQMEPSLQQQDVFEDIGVSEEEPISMEIKEFDPTSGSLFGQLDQFGNAIVRSSDRSFYIKTVGEDQYQISEMKTKQELFPNLFTRNQLAQFEEKLRSQGEYSVSPPEMSEMVASIIKIEKQADVLGWDQYWCNLGQRVAQASPKTPAKPKTPKLPGQLTPEQKEQRRITRKQRRQTMKGLPPGAVVPPRKPIKAFSDDEERARSNEFVRNCEQTFDEIKHILEDDSMRDQPELLADNMNEILERFEEEKERISEETNMEMEDELSITTPPKDKKTLDDLRSASKITVSMSDL